MADDSESEAGRRDDRDESVDAPDASNDADSGVESDADGPTDDGADDDSRVDDSTAEAGSDDEEPSLQPETGDDSADGDADDDDSTGGVAPDAAQLGDDAADGADAEDVDDDADTLDVADETTEEDVADETTEEGDDFGAPNPEAGGDTDAADGDDDTDEIGSFVSNDEGGNDELPVDFADEVGDDVGDGSLDEDYGHLDEPEPGLKEAEAAAIDEPDFDAEYDEFEDDEPLLDGPETDQEMPLAEHIEEMVKRLAVVFIIGAVVSLAVFGMGEYSHYIPSTVEIINYLWDKQIPNATNPAYPGRRPHVYGPLELILTKIKVASIAGVVVGLPVFVYESYLFMRPGLYEHERRYYLAAVPTSLVLALVGVAFAHFVVLPSIFSYFVSYSENAAVLAFGLKETFNLILILMGYMAVVFQIPLFIMLAIMMGLVTRRWLEDKRLIFWGSFLGLAFLVSPDPTGMAPIIIAATMVVLFEGTLALLRWTGN